MASEARGKVLLSLSPHLGWCQFSAPLGAESNGSREQHLSQKCLTSTQQRGPFRPLVASRDVMEVGAKGRGGESEKTDCPAALERPRGVEVMGQETPAGSCKTDERRALACFWVCSAQA